jgi:hypothetical protein
MEYVAGGVEVFHFGIPVVMPLLTRAPTERDSALVRML